MDGLTSLQWDIVNLFNWSITILLFFMAILTILIARARSLTLNHLRAFSALLFGFWVCRLILEFVFPVQIPFVVIPSPSLLLKILMFVALAILVAPELLNILRVVREGREKKHSGIR